MITTTEFDRAMSLSLAGETLVLLPQRAVWWAAQRTLLIADLHFGKEATFRTAGIPIPDQTAQNLSRLSHVVKETRAARLIILGDLIHARRGRCQQTFSSIAAWRKKLPELQVDLVRGNHDVSSGDPPQSWGIGCVEEPHPMAPFLLQHYPTQSTDTAVMAGHVHPMVRLSGPGGDSARLPCFHLRDGVLILPAFSSFVDGACIRPAAGDQIFCICEDRVLKIL